MSVQMAILFALLSALGAGGIISGTVVWTVTSRMKKIADEQKKREDARTMEDRLSYWNLRTSGELAKQGALAWMRGSANGELKEALAEYKKCEAEMDKYKEKMAVIANHR